MKDVDHIKLKIAAGKLDEAINSFLPIAQQAGIEKFNEVVLLSFDYNACRNSQLKGILNGKKADKRLVKIAHQLLMILDSMDSLPEC